MSTIVINIATIPDAEAGRAIHHLGDLPESGVYKAMLHLQNQQTGTALLPLQQHRIVAISVVETNQDRVVRTGSVLGTRGDSHSAEHSEAALLNALVSLLDQSKAVVTWRDTAFILPVLTYRLLKHGIASPALWGNVVGLQAQLSRQHASAAVPLDDLATVLGLPGHLGLDEDRILEHFQAGKFEQISQACTADALNTYLIYLRLQHQQGHLSATELEQRSETLSHHLQASKQTNLQRYADLWLSQQ